jgi:PAS domain S-box-containing protein
VQTFVNDFWPQVTGYTKEELIGRSFFDLVSPIYRLDAIDRYHKKMTGENVPDMYEIIILSKDGREVPIEVISATTHYQGNIANVLYIRDITERKRMNRILTDSETRYAYLFENAPVCLLELDFSLIKQYLDKLHKQGIVDLHDYFNQYPDAVLECSKLARVISMNKAYRDVFKADDNNVFMPFFPEPLEDSQLNRKAIGDDYARLYRGVTLFTKQESVHNLKREIKRVWTSIFIPPGYENSWARLLLSLFDITELKQKKEG